MSVLTKADKDRFRFLSTETRAQMPVDYTQEVRIVSSRQLIREQIEATKKLV